MKYRVHFGNFGIFNQIDVSNQIISVSKPQAQGDPIIISLKDDHTDSSTKFVSEQVRKQFEFLTGAKDYKFNVIIGLVDNDVIVEYWFCLDCVLADVQFENLDSVIESTLIIQPTKFIQKIE